jgi:transposase
MKTYSLDLRQRVLTACDLGELTQAEVAQQFQVSRQWLVKLLCRRRETGSIAALPHGGGRRPKFTGQGQEALRVLVAEDPDATLEELLERSGVEASIMAVHRALERLGCRRKKSRCGPPSKTGRT